jgi:hypothetical protein
VIRPGFCRGDRTTSERDGIEIFFKSSFDKTPDQYGHPDDVALGIKDANAMSSFSDVILFHHRWRGGGAVGDAFLIIFCR